MSSDLYTSNKLIWIKIFVSCFVWDHLGFYNYSFYLEFTILHKRVTKII